VILIDYEVKPLISYGVTKVTGLQRLSLGMDKAYGY
jgi:hypothetical protein